MDYVDTNGNGIPDVFEDRPPITEILNAPPESLPCDRDSIIVEIEKRPREPKKGEYFFCGSNSIQQAKFSYEGFGNKFMILGCYCYLITRTLVHVFIDHNDHCRCRKRRLRRAPTPAPPRQ